MPVALLVIIDADVTELVAPPPFPVVAAPVTPVVPPLPEVVPASPVLFVFTAHAAAVTLAPANTKVTMNCEVFI
jgi:hypothetical protein